MQSTETPDHHGSHQDLIWATDDSAAAPRGIDAIIVPTARRPAYLDEAARLAGALSCTLVTLHSKQWTSAAKAAPLLRQTDRFVAIDVPDPQALRLPNWETSRLLAKTVFARRTDLSAKRNMGVLLSLMLGWRRVLFLDDDITKLNPADVRRASGLLDTHNAVGLDIGGFPDHSVVCHAYLQAGGPQQSFIGGGALAVHLERCRSFFPGIYNDDWFFLLGDKGIQSVAVTGKVRQYPYDPFRSPDRARAEELGDVLAEGIYWLLDQGKSIADADRAHWDRFLGKRKQFICRVLRMVEQDATIGPAERERRVAALKGSLGRLAHITPGLCESFLRAWAVDRQSWQRFLQKPFVRAVQESSPDERLPKALAALSRPGEPRLTSHFRMVGGPQVIPRGTVPLGTTPLETVPLDTVPLGTVLLDAMPSVDADLPSRLQEAALVLSRRPVLRGRPAGQPTRYRLPMTVAGFVAPYLLDTTTRFVAAAAGLPGVQLALITTEPADRLPPDLRRHLAGHWRVDDALDAGQIAWAVEGLGGQLGPLQRLIAVLEQLQVPVAQVREHLGIPGMDPGTARNFRDKAQMKTVLRTAGVPCARHRLADTRESAQDFADEVGFPLVVKPPAGAGAKSTFRLDDPADLRNWLDVAPPTPQNPAMIEEFLTGEEGSYDSVMIDGQLVWDSISNYLPTPLEVLRNPWMQWVVLLPRDIKGPEYDQIRAQAPRALGALGLRTGLTHMEWFRRPDGSVAVSEVGARPPGAQITSMLCYAHDFDLYTAWARLMVDGTFDPPERTWSAGTVYLRGQGAGQVRAVHGLDRLAPETTALIVDERMPHPGQPSSGSYEGDGYITVRHPDTAVVRAALKELVTTVRVELG